MDYLNLISKLTDEEKDFLSAFSVFPEKEVDIKMIFELLAIEADAQLFYFDLIHDLSIKKILIHNKQSYFLNKEIKEVIIKNIPANTENCSTLIKSLSDKFFLPSRSKLEELKIYIPYTENLINGIKDSSGDLAILSNNFASYFEYVDDYNSIKFIKKAIQIQEKADISNQEISFFYNNLAVLYTKIGNYEQSLNFGFESVRRSNSASSKNFVTLANSYNIISTAYDKKKNFKEALNYSLKAIEIGEEYFKEKTIILAGYYHDIAITFYNLKNYQNARHYIDKAIINYAKKVKTEDSFMKKMLTYKSVFTMYYKFEKAIKKALKYIVFIVGIALIALILYFIFIK